MQDHRDVGGSTRREGGITAPRGEDPARLLRQIWAQAQIEEGVEPGAVAAGNAPAALTFREPGLLLPGVFRVDLLAAVCTALTGLAAAQLWRLRSGRMQAVGISQRAAQVAFRSERYLRIEREGQGEAESGSPIWGYYRTADRRWIQLHTNFPHHEQGVLALLGCTRSRKAVARAVSQREGLALEAELIARGLCASLMRERAEWLAHPQGAAVSRLPLMEITRIGEAPARPLPGSVAGRPLQGVRVLDLTRVIAGPVCGRTLAEHGAEVLRVHAPHLPSFPALDIETGRGKRSAFLDLREQAARGRLSELAGEADVFVQGYRPGALARLGFAPEDLAERRPGIVYVSLSAFGHAGPWAGRRGFDSLVQMASGICAEGAAASGEDGPGPLPCQALDHASGYLAAFGAMTALARRAREGGSWMVRISLAQVSEWLWHLGRIDALRGLGLPDPTFEDVADLIETTDSELGRVHAVRPVAELAETPGHWATPATALGRDRAAWHGT